MNTPDDQTTWLRALFGPLLGAVAVEALGSTRGPSSSGTESAAGFRAFAELTGPAEGPGCPPERSFAERVELLSTLLSALTGATVDGFHCLVERASYMPALARRGATACGGATRLVRAADTMLAVALSRPSDVESLPAFLGAVDDTFGHLGESGTLTGIDDDAWPVVAAAIARGPAGKWVEQANLLGMAVSELGETPVPHEAAPAVRSTGIPTEAAVTRNSAPLVVDLSSLWAGPLCSRFLQRAGMQVIKVEDVNRPDGGRIGSPEFFAALNEGREFRRLDFRTPAGSDELRTLLMSADVVIEASRPRALKSLDLDAEILVNDGGPRVWTSITGHGRIGSGANRVAFGDDAAVAGGLVHWQGSTPCFLGDAVADPLTGMVAAAATLLAWRTGRAGVSGTTSTLLDVAMARVAAAFSGRPRNRPQDEHL